MRKWLLSRLRVGPWIVNPVLVAGVLVYVIAVASGGLAFDKGSIAQQVRDLLWFALLCGIAASATIEVFKRVFQFRGRFQARETRTWLCERSQAEDGYDQLLEAMGLSEGKRRTSAAVLRVFNLPTEQLTAQISAAADVALSAPDRYSKLIAGLTGDAPGPEAPEQPEKSGIAEKSGIVAQRVRAGVDQLQISLGERWRRQVQGAALWISAAFGILLIEGSAGHAGVEARYALAALLVGGLLAWTLRDVAAVIERSRR